MNSKKILMISGALLGFTLTGATIMYGISNYKALDELDFTIDGVKFKCSKTSLTINILVTLKNPTDFKLKLYGYNFAVTLDGVYLGEVSTSDVVEVAKNGYTKMVIPFKLNKSDYSIDHITELVQLLTKVVKGNKLKAYINGSAVCGFNRIIKTTIDFKDYEVYAINGDVTEQSTQEQGLLETAKEVAENLTK